VADIPGDISTTATITVGATVNNSLETVGDHDWFRLNLTAGQAVTVSIHGVSLDDSYLRIYDQNGNMVYENDDASSFTLDSRVAFAASYSGVYYIDVGSWDDRTAGTYQLSVANYVAPAAVSLQAVADQLKTGYWGPGDAHHFNVTSGGSLTVNLTALTAAGQNLARAALATWTDVIGVTFREVATGGQITFDDTDTGAATSGTWSNGITTSAHVNVGTDWLTSYGTSLQSYSFQTYIHEIGHALGLGHAGDYNGDGRYPYDTTFANDGWSETVMSYFDQRQSTYFANLGFDRNYVATPMMADVLAATQLYGASTTTRVGDSVYGPNWTTSMGTICIVDSAGNDTIDVSSYGGSQTVDLRPATFSNVLGEVGNVSIGPGITIENAITGAGNDTIVGNDVANVVTGGLGRDTLTGGGGADIFSDTAAGHNGDTITDFSASDSLVFTDAVYGNFTYSLTGGTLTYTGGSLIFGSGLSGTLSASAVTGGGVKLSIAAAATSYPSVFNTAGSVLVGNFNAANGWTSQDQLPRHVADMNGDGNADIVGFGTAGVYVAYGSAAGSFGAAQLVLGNFNAANGWTSDNLYHRALADLGGDGRADIIGFGTAGTYVSVAKADGTFGTTTLGAADFGQNQGWSSQDERTRLVGDVNGDGKADIVGFGTGATFVALGNGDGTFQPVKVGIANFAANQGWTSDNLYHRELADVNGDGKLDIVGFGIAGTYVALSNGDGTFANAKLTFADFGTAQGWSNNDAYHRVVGDVNGDGKADIVGFTAAGTLVAFGNGDGSFGPAHLDVADFGGNQGWSSDNSTHRELADLNHDGKLDIVGFGNLGVVAGLNHYTGF